MIDQEIHQAREALRSGDYVQARHHLNNARTLNADPGLIQQVLFEIESAEQGVKNTYGHRVFFAVMICCVGYLILSFQQPRAWNQIVWELLAFGLIPVFSGILAGRSFSDPAVRAGRFKRGFLIAFFTMAAYTMINVVIVRSRMDSADHTQNAKVFFLVAAVYGLIAGAVAGVSALTFGRGTQR